MREKAAANANNSDASGTVSTLWLASLSEQNDAGWSARLFSEPGRHADRLASIQYGVISLWLCASVIRDAKIMRLLADHRTQPPASPSVRPSVLLAGLSQSYWACHVPCPARATALEQPTTSCARDVRQTNSAYVAKTRCNASTVCTPPDRALSSQSQRSTIVTHQLIPTVPQVSATERAASLSKV